MRFHKGVASQDDAVAKVSNSAAQPLLEREFALLQLNDLLSRGQVKSTAPDSDFAAVAESAVGVLSEITPLEIELLRLFGGN